MRPTALLRPLLAVVCLCLLSACMPSRERIRSDLAVAAQRQDRSLDCARADRCAEYSRLRIAAAEAVRDSRPEAPQHVVLNLETGRDALLARLHLIRAARHSIELQSFIFAEDDAGFLVLDELLRAARRGVRVRILLDQLFSLEDTRLLAGLAQAHVNFELRLYNPTFAKGRTSKAEFVGGILCCFTRFNQRMHNKLLLVDGLLGITGGRNYQERYFDWDPGFNYRDRDILVGGPAAAAMQRNFEEFWQAQRSLPAAALRDVRGRLAESPAAREVLADPPLRRPERIEALRRELDDRDRLQAVLIEPLHRVGRVDFHSDRPEKQLGTIEPGRRDSSHGLRRLVMRAEHEIILQTPYLVLSDEARRSFRRLRQREQPPRVRISTNSLASTDAFPVYALSHKYKRTYLREFGFEIHEYKPHPANAPIALSLDPEDDAIHLPPRFLRSESSRVFGSAAAGSAGSALTPSRRALRGPLPLRTLGMRIGLHSKSLVIDGDLAVVGSHNFDPRSDRLNTESLVVVHDRDFAQELRGILLEDMAPENAWVIAPRPRPPRLLRGINYSLGKAFEYLPLFDFWPWRYATSWEYTGGEGCTPMSPFDPRFADCHQPVGDFPEVDFPFKAINTRILTAFGAGLAPIL
jgi:putative cardiolipin synthase